MNKQYNEHDIRQDNNNNNNYNNYNLQQQYHQQQQQLLLQQQQQQYHQQYQYIHNNNNNNNNNNNQYQQYYNNNNLNNNINDIFYDVNGGNSNDKAEKIIDMLHSRIKRLEDINIKLETHLEAQARELLNAEYINVQTEEMNQKIQLTLRTEIEEWKTKYNQQVAKTERCREHLSRTERELYGILQRKYQLLRGGPSAGKRKQGDNQDYNDNELHDTNGYSKDENFNNVHSLGRILTMNDTPQTTSTPLSNIQSEEIADVYKRLDPSQRPSKFLDDMSEFLGI